MNLKLKAFSLLSMSLMGLALVFFQSGYAQNVIHPNIESANGLFVNSYTGTLTYEREDLLIPGEFMPMEISFGYNSSRRARDLGYGLGWSFPYTMYYLEDSLRVIIVHKNGRRDIFLKNGANFDPPTGVFYELERIPEGFTLQEKEGLTYYFEDSSHQQLTRMVDPNDNILSLDYDSEGRLIRMTDPYDRSLHLRWEDGHMVEVIDSLEVPVRSVQYQYEDNLLVKVIDPMGYEEEYVYNAERQLVQMADKRDNVTTIYYNPNASVEKIVSCLTIHNFTYNTAEQTTYFVEKVRGGQNITTTYDYGDDGKLAEKKGNCCGYKVGYEYDEDNNITQRTDANDHLSSFTYDDRGNVLSQTDPLGYTQSFTYEPEFNRMTSMTDKRGNTTSFRYDTDGNLTRIDYPLGIFETFTYNQEGKKIRETDKNGNITHYEYDVYRNLSVIREPLGRTTVMNYGPRGNLLSEVDPNGNITRYVYDLNDRVDSIIRPLGSIATFSYDEIGNKISETDPNGNTTTFEYDGLNRLIAVNEPNAITTHYEYDEQGNQIKMVDPNGNAYIYTYTTQGFRESETDPLGNTIYYVHDGVGNVLSMTDKRGNTTTYEYDVLDRLVKEVDPLGYERSYTYDPNGNKSSITNKNGNSTIYSYDELNRKIKEIDPLGFSLEFGLDGQGNSVLHVDKEGKNYVSEYDSLNRLIRTINPLGYEEIFDYDPKGNKVLEVSKSGDSTIFIFDERNRIAEYLKPLGEFIKYGYDSNNNLAQVRTNNNYLRFIYDQNDRIQVVFDSLGTVKGYEYDSNGNIIKVIYPDGNSDLLMYDNLNRITGFISPLSDTMKFVFDKNGNQISEIYRDGNIRGLKYDENNRLVNIKNEDGNIYQFRYDGVGNRTSIIDPNLRKTNYIFDPNNNIVSEIYPDGTILSLKYDKNNNLIEKIDGKGNSILFEYDDLNRLRRRSSSNFIQSDQFEYDEEDRIIVAINDIVELAFSYDRLGNISKETLNNDSLQVIYDPEINTIKRIYPDGSQVLEKYDPRDRLEEIYYNDSLITKYTYNTQDLTTNISYSNNTWVEYSYDSLSRVSEIIQNPDTFFFTKYLYDKENRVIKELRLDTDHFTKYYVYDNANRLVKFLEGSRVGNMIQDTTSLFTYKYDNLGNRKFVYRNNLTEEYTSNEVNEYVSNNGAAYVNDKNGNLTEDNINKYEYDYLNRLTKINTNNTIITYKYDPIGRRYSTIYEDPINQTSDTTQYFYNSDRKISEKKLSSQEVTNFIFGTGLDEIILRVFDGDFCFFHHDLRNNIIGISNKQGHLIERYEYLPFGDFRIYSPDFFEQLDSSFLSNNIYFSGKWFESSINKYDFRARAYSPELGRFLQRDPSGFVDSYNLYEYSLNNPINFSDPSGAALPLVLPAVQIIGPIIGGWIVRQGAKRLIVIGGRIVLNKKLKENVATVAINGAKRVLSETEYKRLRSRCDDLHKSYHDACDNPARRCDANLPCKSYDPIINEIKSCINLRQQYLDEGCEDIYPDDADHKGQIELRKQQLINCVDRKLRACMNQCF